MDCSPSAVAVVSVSVALECALAVLKSYEQVTAPPQLIGVWPFTAAGAKVWFWPMGMSGIVVAPVTGAWSVTKAPTMAIAAIFPRTLGADLRMDMRFPPCRRLWGRAGAHAGGGTEALWSSRLRPG